MPMLNPSGPSVPDAFHVDGSTLDTSWLLIADTRLHHRDLGRLSALRTILDADAQRLLVNPPGPTVARSGCEVTREGAPLPLQPQPGARVFTKRVPGLSARKARRSDWLAVAQIDTSMVLGGESSARLSRQLSMPVSGDTILRLIRRRGSVPSPQPRVVGIDDRA